MEEGFPEPCVIYCGNILTQFDPQPVGRLNEIVRANLDRALRHALDIAY